MNAKQLMSCCAVLAFLTLPCFSQSADQPAPAAAEDVTAEGSGLGSTEAEALMNAKRDAIEKGIGLILLSQTEIENFMVKRDQIISKTVGAVRSYEVLSKGKSPDGLFQVKIRAVINRSAMREDLAAFHILIESMDKPRVMVVVAENNVGNQEPTNQAAEGAIIKFLRDPYEFEMVDPQVSASVRASQQKMNALEGSPSAAAAIGSQYNAEVLITGSAVSREAQAMSQNLGGMVSVQADVTLKAINCTSGRIIGSSSGHAAKVHVSPNTAGTQAIAKAADGAIKDLLNSIIKDWQGQQNNGVPINITVKGVVNFRAKNAVLQTLQGISAVAAAHERSWDGQSAALVVDIQYKGTITGFCTKIDGFKLKSGSGSLSVMGVNGMSVTLQVEAM